MEKTFVRIKVVKTIVRKLNI